METLRKFEGASLDDILAHVYQECGVSATIVEANRIRRGGVGGFFAKEGFEVVVIPDPAHGAGAAPDTETSASHDETDPATRGARLDVTEEEDELLADFLAGRATAEPATEPATELVTEPVAVTPATAPVAPEVFPAAPAAEEQIETLPARRVLKAARIMAHGERRDESALEPVVALVGPAETPGSFSFGTVLDRALADEPVHAVERDGTGTMRPVFDDGEPLGDADEATFDRLPAFGEDDFDAAGESLSDDDLRLLLGVDDLGDAVRAGGPSGPAGAAVLSSWQDGAFDEHATETGAATSGAPELRADTVADEMFDDVAGDEPTVDLVDGVSPTDAVGTRDLLAADAPESTLDALTRRFATFDATGTDTAAAAGAAGTIAIDEPATPTAVPADPEAGIVADAAVLPEAPAATPTRRRTRAASPTAAPAKSRTRKTPGKTASKTAGKTAAKPATAKPATAKATKARTGTAAATRSRTRPAAAPARPDGALDLMARYAAVPAAPEAPAVGTVVVVGTPADALAVAQRLAGGDTPIVLASPDATGTDIPAPVAILRDVEDAGRLRTRAVGGGTRRANAPRQIVVVDAGTGMRGLAWARRVLDVLEPDHVRLAVPSTEAADDVRATADLLDGVVALDVVTGDGAAVPVDELLGIGVPVGSIGGWPASPALWAALTLEGTNRG